MSPHNLELTDNTYVLQEWIAGILVCRNNVQLLSEFLEVVVEGMDNPSPALRYLSYKLKKTLESSPDVMRIISSAD